MYITASRAFTLKLPVALLAKRLQTQSVALPLVTPGVEDRSLLLKIPCTSETELRDS